LDIRAINEQAGRFRKRLDELKARLDPQDFAWYPYGTLDNFSLLDQLLKGNNRRLLDLIGDGVSVDIGAADGDTAFFLESLGRRMHVVDFAPTNYNGCRGVRLLKSALGSSVEIAEIDLDRRFELPAARYELAFFLGILYHLKNPYAALEGLARHARHALVSTRIVRFNLAEGAPTRVGLNARRVELASVPAAYLVDEDECNKDPTNFWMFSEAGLRRLLHRTGWEVLDYMSVGNTTTSDPATPGGDERAFCLVRSRHA
jgi:hypothetical protein